jgi:hypothetical protein
MQFEYTEPQTEFELLVGGHRSINMFGRIDPGDDQRFINFLDRLAPPPRTEVYIDSPGGDVEAAIAIGRKIRDAWYSTSVGQVVLRPNPNVPWRVPREYLPGQCLSAATLAYLGGRLRHMQDGSKFGVHQFSYRDPTPEHVGDSQILSTKIAKFLMDMGIEPEFMEVSSAVPGNLLKLLCDEELAALGIVTGGQTGVVWSVESRNNMMYVKGERDSIYGHHKVMLCYSKHVGFMFWAVLEAQGRHEELCSFALVEIVLDGEQTRIDISQRCDRQLVGIYVNVLAKITETEAEKISKSDSFGIQIRFGSEAPVFLGVGAMSTEGGKDMLDTFYQTLCKE